MRGDAATHYLVRRHHRVRLAGVVPPAAYFEGYHHLFGETEFVDAAQAAGVFAPCTDAIVEHLHPLVGKAQHDATYEHGERHAARDRQLYEQRAAA
jgi:hypothetical protein